MIRIMYEVEIFQSKVCDEIYSYYFFINKDLND